MAVRTLLVALLALLAAASTVAGAGNARADAGSVKFAVTFKGQISGTWRNTQAKGTRCGSPGESWGSFTSTVTPTGRPWTVTVSTGLDGIGYRWSDWGKPGGQKAKVVTTRKGEGWRTKGDCYPYKDALVPIPLANSGCGTKTETSSVQLVKIDRFGGTTTHPVFLNWVPAQSLDCPASSHEDQDKKGRYLEQVTQRLSYPTLYRCGTRPPKGCKLTIGKSKTFSVREQYTDYNYPERSGLYVNSSTIRVSWSVTFTAVG
jgi:hypothetical protein